MTSVIGVLFRAEDILDHVTEIAGPWKSEVLSMFMIRAIVRPEKYEEVMAALLDADIPGVTRLSIQGRGRQRGLKVGGTHYDELPKEMLLVVVTAAEKDYALNAILRAARTGEKGVFGDGKIFVSAVEEVYTVSSGKREWPQE